MCGIKKCQMAAAGLALGLAGVVADAAYAGCVEGTNTVDYVLFVVEQGDTVHFSVDAWGSGTNELDVKIQGLTSSGWTTLIHFELNMPSDSRSGSLVVPNMTSGSTQELLRFRLGRKIGTKKICYDVDLS